MCWCSRRCTVLTVTDDTDAKPTGFRNIQISCIIDGDSTSTWISCLLQRHTVDRTRSRRHQCALAIRKHHSQPTRIRQIDIACRIADDPGRCSNGCRRGLNIGRTSTGSSSSSNAHNGIVENTIHRRCSASRTKVNASCRIDIQWQGL